MKKVLLFSVMLLTALAVCAYETIIFHFRMVNYGNPHITKKSATKQFCSTFREVRHQITGQGLLLSTHITKTSHLRRFLHNMRLEKCAELIQTDNTGL